MIEENVVRAAGASYCMDEIEIVRNIENAGFAAEAPQHALRDPRRSDLPRARGPAHAGAGRRPRRRRHEPRAGSRSLRRAERRRRSGASSGADRPMLELSASMPAECDRLPALPGTISLAPPGSCRSRRRRFATAGSRVDRRPHRRRRRLEVAPDRLRRRATTADPRPTSPSCRARQRAHASRAVVDARAGAAGASMPAWAVALMALRRTVRRRRRWPPIERRDRARCARAGTVARRRRHQHARDVRAARGERAVGGRSSAS